MNTRQLLKKRIIQLKIASQVKPPPKMVSSLSKKAIRTMVLVYQSIILKDIQTLIPDRERGLLDKIVSNPKSIFSGFFQKKTKGSLSEKEERSLLNLILALRGMKKITGVDISTVPRNFKKKYTFQLPLDFSGWEYKNLIDPSKIEQDPPPGSIPVEINMIKNFTLTEGGFSWEEISDPHTWSIELTPPIKLLVSAKFFTDKNAYKTFIFRLKTIQETLYHELQHFAQIFLSKYGKNIDQFGLVSRKSQNPSIDQSQSDPFSVLPGGMDSYYLDDIEFYTWIENNSNTLISLLDNLPQRLWRAGVKHFMGLKVKNPQELFQLKKYTDYLQKEKPLQFEGNIPSTFLTTLKRFGERRFLKEKAKNKNISEKKLKSLEKIYKKKYRKAVSEILKRIQQKGYL